MKKRISYKLPIKPPIFNEGIVNRFEHSAIIGMWRMGNSDSVISNILNIDLSKVNGIVKLYESICDKEIIG